MRRPFAGKYPITQEWGVNPQDYARFGLKGHNGVDYAVPVGTPILAPHSGTVIEAAYDATGYGTYVKIENDIEGSILAHLSKHLVNPGDYVTEGTQIGLSGNTGNSTGPHLHWGYFRKPRNKSDGYSGTTNPWQYLDENKPKPPQEDPLQACLRQHADLLKQLESANAKCISLQDSISTLNKDLLNSRMDTEKALNDLKSANRELTLAKNKLIDIQKILNG